MLCILVPRSGTQFARAITLTQPYAVRQLCASEVTPATWTTPTGGPRRGHGALFTSQVKQGTLWFATAILPVTVAACRFNKHGLDADGDYKILVREYDYIWSRCCCSKERVFMRSGCKIKFFPLKTGHVLPFSGICQTLCCESVGLMARCSWMESRWDQVLLKSLQTCKQLSETVLRHSAHT